MIKYDTIRYGPTRYDTWYEEASGKKRKIPVLNFLGLLRCNLPCQSLDDFADKEKALGWGSGSGQALE